MRQKNPLTLPRLHGRKFGKETDMPMIQEPFRRMLKVTIIGMPARSLSVFCLPFFLRAFLCLSFFLFAFIFFSFLDIEFVHFFCL
jgi:hypothetical protein